MIELVCVLTQLSYLSSFLSFFFFSFFFFLILFLGHIHAYRYTFDIVCLIELMASSSGSFLPRDQFKKRKELEEARKAGKIPALVDEDGQEINPHIPQYIAEAPWYMSTDHPSLKHQRISEKKDDEVEEGLTWHKRRKGTVARKYRKGACENCGAMTHKTKDCLDRPRKVGAKYTGRDIRADEFYEEAKMDYEAKRDSWGGYDPRSYVKTYDTMTRIEELRREERGKRLEVEGDGGEEVEDIVEKGKDEENEDFIEKEGGGAATVSVGSTDPRMHGVVRNLMIRESIPKYLYNLSLNSAFYDPKSRSMRENPIPDADAAKDGVFYRGDNAERHSRDTKDFHEQRLFAVEAERHGEAVNLTAGPTQAELAFKEFVEKKREMEDEEKKEIHERYGVRRNPMTLSKEILLGQSTGMHLYSKSGKVLSSASRSKISSRYEEDKFIGGHTSVWGSYWKDGRWGYACCRLLERSAVCPSAPSSPRDDDASMEEIEKKEEMDKTDKMDGTEEKDEMDEKEEKEEVCKMGKMDRTEEKDEKEDGNDGIVLGITEVDDSDD
eukprot:TRINITY_DN850_c5_g1_i1.p1 TRINITY_DN850_c5_g1~~TRINITY_DN850_c5_g1_i1.p1  ORF type:complete len:552 (-),score=195.46 TRINITY_DN850_c5_g1_i1:119-1774(-)